MIITLETASYIISIVSVLCSAAYKLDYENGKNAKK